VFGSKIVFIDCNLTTSGFGASLNPGDYEAVLDYGNLGVDWAVGGEACSSSE
jgi:hypothetical protein